jgi:DNA-binding MarR family transcriptional regulator
VDSPPGAVATLIGLLRRHYVETGRLNRAFAERHHLHPTDWAALLAVAQCDAAGDPLTPGDLGDRLGMSSGATTAVVDRLEGARYVRRARDGRDRRRVTLHSADGAPSLVTAFFDPLETAMETLVGRFDEPELATVRRFLVEAVAEVVEHRRGLQR